MGKNTSRFQKKNEEMDFSQAWESNNMNEMSTIRIIHVYVTLEMNEMIQTSAFPNEIHINSQIIIIF